MKQIARLATVFLLALLSGSIYASSDLKPSQSPPAFPVSLQLNWHPQFEYAGFFAAIKQGYYQKNGLNVQVKHWHPDSHIVKDVSLGRLDFGVVYGSAVADFAKGMPIKLVMPTLQFSPMVYLSHEPIKRWEDLDGKVIIDQDNLYLKDLLVKLKGSSTHENNLIYKPSIGDLHAFIDGKVDLYAAYETNEPYRLKKMGVPFHILDPKSYGVQGYGDLLVTSEKFAAEHPDLVYKFKQATIKGWQYALKHPKEIVDYLISHYPVRKSREALLDEAEKLERFIRSGDTPIGDIDLYKLKVMASEAKDVGLINQQQFNHFEPDKFVFNSGKLHFTPEELAYLAKNPIVKLANDVNWGPFQFINDKGKYAGITADYFHLLSEKLGLTFQTVKHKNWNQVVAMAEAGKLDVYPCAVATPERQTYMKFTRPYLSFPMVLVGRDSMSYVNGYSELNGQKVASVKGGWSAEFLKKHFPNIIVVPVATVKEGIEAVIEGRAKAFSGNLGVINFTLQQYGLTGVSVVGQSSHRFDIAVGVQKDNPILFNILQKGLDSITDKERQKIYNKWVKLEVIQKLDSTQLITIAIAVTIVVFTLLTLALVYRYQKNKQQSYINQVHELTYAAMIDMSDYTLVQVSDSYARLTGYSRDELLGKNYLTLASHRVPPEKQQQLIERLLSGQSWQGEISGINKSGEEYWVALTLTPIKNVMGNVSHVWATRVDITDKKRIEKLNIIDEMTGLYNRRHFNEVIEREINRAKRTEIPLALAMIDVDFFKSINDTYGHQRGDEVLKQVAQCFQKSFGRASDAVFRMGGEEFLILSTFESEEAFSHHLERLCHEVAALDIKNDGSEYAVLTISIGGVFYRHHQLEDASSLYHEADQKLYQAKQTGRNRVVV